MTEDLKNTISRGVEAKLLQYEEYAKDRCETQIDLKPCLEKLFQKQLDGLHCIMINLEDHTERYNNTVEELKKISCTNLVHFKGTYWKSRATFQEDLRFVINFLSQFNPEIDANKTLYIDAFSEVNDENIYVQDGPLACYCSHLRALIYGFLNFQDYTLIVEDDISIINTAKIEQYLSQIPDDWDMICLGACPKFRVYDEKETFYKFTDSFHSTHFYIVNNKCLPKIFRGVYPITDQVDVLFSNMIHDLNIYNLAYTVFQKNIGTHTQNNLHVIFNSPNYDVLRTAITSIKKNCTFFINSILPNNQKRNEIIVSNLMYDALYEYILQSGLEEKFDNREDYNFDYSQYANLPEFEELLMSITFFVRCSKKGINPNETGLALTKNLLFTMQNFKLHNTEVGDHLVKAYGFGSSAQVYLEEDKKFIIKVYNDKLRWTTAGYENSSDIFQTELDILKAIQHLKHVPRLLDYSDKAIRMSYEGESLYNHWKLPSNWQAQIQKIFDDFTASGVYYPEFRLQNILVKRNKIKFVDFGMAELSPKSNHENCSRFINLLSLLDAKLSSISNQEKRYELIDKFFRNLALNA